MKRPLLRSYASAATRISPGAARAISRAARAAVSPRIAYVRRNGAPTCPAKTRPRLGADVDGNGGSASTTARSVRSIRSSSSPAVSGAPATRTILPPSRSMSLSRNVTPCSSAALWTSRTSASSACAAASGPSSSIRPSCAGEADEAHSGISVLAFRGTSSNWARNGPGIAARAGVRRSPGAARRLPRPPALAQQQPVALGSPSLSASSAAAVSGLTRISPASDAASISTVRDADGPVTSNSRCDAPEVARSDDPPHRDERRRDRGLEDHVRDVRLPAAARGFRRLHPRFKTPWIALVVFAGVTASILLGQDLDAVSVGATSFRPGRSFAPPPG